jgi:hypothetical protein
LDVGDWLLLWLVILEKSFSDKNTIVRYRYGCDEREYETGESSDRKAGNWSRCLDARYRLDPELGCPGYYSGNPRFATLSKYLLEQFA